MKLFTRLIDSGVFVFWSEEEGDATFNLKIRIAVGDEKITLVDLNPSMGQNYYSFDRVGSGDYEIELNAFRNNVLYQTETKKVKIISSVQKTEETMETLLQGVTTINNNIYSIGTDINELQNLLLNIKRAQTDPETIVKIRRLVNRYEREGY